MKVTVLVMTYNHERFLSQALDSVVEQRVGFDHEILVSEDCSTDRTRDIVVAYSRRHPDRIRPILSETNLASNEIVARGIRAARGEYLALLDGDDYWTSPHKLAEAGGLPATGTRNAPLLPPGPRRSRGSGPDAVELDSPRPEDDLDDGGHLAGQLHRHRLGDVPPAPARGDSRLVHPALSDNGLAAPPPVRARGRDRLPRRGDERLPPSPRGPLLALERSGKSGEDRALLRHDERQPGPPLSPGGPRGPGEVLLRLGRGIREPRGFQARALVPEADPGQRDGRPDPAPRPRQARLAVGRPRLFKVGRGDDTQPRWS